ncbi:hypothetical protein EON64_05725, partial [archaeon]
MALQHPHTYTLSQPTYTYSYTYAHTRTVLPYQNPLSPKHHHPSSLLVRCYLRLSENPRAREALKKCLPDALKDTSTFSSVITGEENVQRWLGVLLKNLGIDAPT